VGSIYTQPPRRQGWFWALFLGWIALLSMGIVAAWMIFGAVDSLVPQPSPRTATVPSSVPPPSR